MTAIDFRMKPFFSGETRLIGACPWGCSPIKQCDLIFRWIKRFSKQACAKTFRFSRITAELKVMMRSQFVHTERVHNFDGKGCGPKFALLLYLSLFCFFSVPTQWIEFKIRTHIEDTRKKLKQTKSQRQRALMKIRPKMRRRGKRHIERVYLGKRHRAQSTNTKKGEKN